MATIYYSGNQRAQAVQYYVTVSAVSTGNTITATINGKTETYTCLSSDTAITAAANAAQQFASSLLLELRNFSFSSPANGIIQAVGPASGAPLAVTFGGTATISGTSPSVTSKSPADVGDTANYVGGSLPTTGDTLVLENGSFNLLYNLATFASLGVNLIRRASHTGQVGLPDNNPLGYPEYLPVQFQTQGTAITVEDGGKGFVRIKSTGSSAVTAVITGTSSGTLGKENVELSGTPASSVIDMNGGGLAFCPLSSQSGTAATVLVANAAFRAMSGATITTLTAQSAKLSLGTSVTTLTIDDGTTTTLLRAGGGTTLNIYNSSVSHNSTGGWTTVNIYNGGSYDVSQAPATVAVTTVNLNEGGTFLDPNKRITRSFTLNQIGHLANMRLNLGFGAALTVA